MAAEWQIKEYVAKSGRRPLAEFYIGLKSEDDRGGFVAVTAALAEWGNHLGLPHSKAVGERLFELRQGRVRIFYVFAGKQKVTPCCTPT